MKTARHSIKVALSKKRERMILLSLLLLAMSPRLEAQTPQQAATSPSTNTITSRSNPNSNRIAPYPRNNQAIQILQNSVSGLGGLALIRSIHSWTIDSTHSSPTQTNPTTVQWKIAGEEVREEASSANDTSVLTSGHGQPAFQNASGTHPLHTHVLHAMFHPELVAKYIQERIDDQRYSVEYLGTDSAGEAMVRTIFHATLMDQAVTSQMWYFDKVSGLPAKVEYRLPDMTDPNKYAVATVSLGDYRAVNGVSIPFGATVALGNAIFKTIQLNDVHLNTSFSPDEFAPLQGNTR